MHHLCWLLDSYQIDMTSAMQTQFHQFLTGSSYVTAVDCGQRCQMQRINLKEPRWQPSYYQSSYGYRSLPVLKLFLYYWMPHTPIVEAHVSCSLLTVICLVIRDTAARSINLDRNWRFEIGLKDLWIKVRFYKGVFFLHISVESPEERDSLTILVIVGSKMSIWAWTNQVGIGSRKHVASEGLIINFRISSSVA